MPVEHVNAKIKAFKIIPQQTQKTSVADNADMRYYKRGNTDLSCETGLLYVNEVIKSVLAIETTEKFGSVALLNNKTVLAEIDLPKDRRSSETLNPAIAQIFAQTSITPADVAAVAVVIGPGSFTGLRVGVTAAKVFAYSTGAKIVAVTTFEAMKHSGNESIGVDAQRNEVVVSINNAPATMMSIDDWFKQREYFPGIVFTGPALKRYAAKAPPDAVLAAECDWFPKASIVGQIAAERIGRQQFDDVFSLLPIYSRLSAAEERLACDSSEPRTV